MLALEWIITIVAAGIFITQVVVPIVKDRPVFPVFRKSWADRQLADAERVKREAEALLRAEQTRAEAMEKHKRAEELKDRVIDEITRDKGRE